MAKATITLILCVFFSGCVTQKLSEVASRELPDDAVWVVARPTLTRSLSDLDKLRFVETNSQGVIVREKVFEGTYDRNIGQCAGFSALANPFEERTELVELNNEVLLQNPNIEATAIASLNRTPFGKFEVLNTQALWFARTSTNIQTETGATIPKGVIRGSIKAGRKGGDLLLIAVVSTLKFTASNEYRECLVSGYKNNPDTKTHLARFASASQVDNITKAVVYEGAVVGSLVGLTITEATFDSNIDAKASASEYNVKFTAELSLDNISLDYKQYGILDDSFSLERALDILKTKRDSNEVLKLLRKSTTRMAIVAVVPLEIKL